MRVSRDRAMEVWFDSKCMVYSHILPGAVAFSASNATTFTRSTFRRRRRGHCTSAQS
jgi:hypothetical protein